MRFACARRRDHGAPHPRSRRRGGRTGIESRSWSISPRRPRCQTAVDVAAESRSTRPGPQEGPRRSAARTPRRQWFSVAVPGRKQPGAPGWSSTAPERRSAFVNPSNDGQMRGQRLERWTSFGGPATGVMLSGPFRRTAAACVGKRDELPASLRLVAAPSPTSKSIRSSSRKVTTDVVAARRVDGVTAPRELVLTRSTSTRTPARLSPQIEPLEGGEPRSRTSA